MEDKIIDLSFGFKPLRFKKHFDEALQQPNEVIAAGAMPREERSGWCKDSRNEFESQSFKPKTQVIGVLALQGGFYAHIETLHKLGVSAIEVKRAHDLEKCSGLILPGGESTSMSCILQKMGLIDPLCNFARTKPLFGTCAGLIILAQLGLIAIEVERNAYGRQNHSFSTEVLVDLEEPKVACEALFIRAPKITAISDQVKVRAYYQNDPVFIQQNNILCATFHSELTDNKSIHAFFVSKCYPT